MTGAVPVTCATGTRSWGCVLCVSSCLPGVNTAVLAGPPSADKRLNCSISPLCGHVVVQKALCKG